MSKASRIGGYAEWGVIHYAKANGFPYADKLAKTGRYDRGDVRLTKALAGGVVIEVKGGQAAKAASRGQVERWWCEELQPEIGHSGARFGFLVLQRAGYSDQRAGHWRAFLRLSEVLMVTQEMWSPPLVDPLVEIPYGELLQLLEVWPGVAGMSSAAAEYVLKRDVENELSDLQ